MTWFILEIDRASSPTFQRAQQHIKARVANFDDETLMLFLTCFQAHREAFSQSMMRSVRDVILEKLPRFNAKSLVNILWTISNLQMWADESQIITAC